MNREFQKCSEAFILIVFMELSLIECREPMYWVLVAAQLIHNLFWLNSFIQQMFEYLLFASYY